MELMPEVRSKFLSIQRASDIPEARGILLFYLKYMILSMILFRC